MTEMTDKRAGRRRHWQPIDSAWLVYLCVCASACCIYANASGYVNSVWACCAHAVWEHRSAFTGTDPQGQDQIDGQMERQSIISRLVQRFSNLFVPNEQHIDPAFLVPLHQSLTQKHTRIA